MKLPNKIIVFILTIALLSVTINLSLPKRAQGIQEVKIENIQTITSKDHAVELAKSIALIETGGTMDCSIIGGNGERGCHQYSPGTWASYSKDVLGYVAKQTPANAQKVTEGKMREFIKQGLTDRQIFLIWNQGSTGQCRRGTNSKGVHYDSCAYVATALKILQEVMHTG